MITVVILLLVVGGTLLTLTYCVLLNETNSNLAIAANDAQFVLEQIKQLAYSSISSYTPPSLANLNNETIAVQCIPDTGIMNVTVNVGWNERQRARNFSLSTRIAD
ncbi:MAG: hypothetical protein JSV34_03540 [Candidatus Omnitrophota bacterium]|nr:MAG: hypothetical protein JSV34_03540 [Candidatus Omnitrophota bacterium]